MSRPQQSYGNLIAIIGSGTVYLLIWALELGSPLTVVLSALVFGSAGVVAWLEGFRYAGVGYSIIILGLGVLLFGIKDDPVVAVAFFGCVLASGGLVVYEGVVRADKWNRERNGFAG